MKTDLNFGGVNFGLKGFTGVTPKWAAIASNYLLLATVALFFLSAFVTDWEWIIPDTKKAVIDSVIDSLEKTLVSVATALRWLGIGGNPKEDANEYTEG